MDEEYNLRFEDEYPDYNYDVVDEDYDRLYEDNPTDFNGDSIVPLPFEDEFWPEIEPDYMGK